jgi:Ni/Co efflux regulator RcnB
MVQAGFIARALVSPHAFERRLPMKKFTSLIAAAALLAGTGGAFAQGYNRGHDDHHDDHHGPSMTMHGPRHPDWHQGGHIARNDWGRGRHVDYRAHHLRTPPRGYEWRQVDDNYVLAAVATGLIASVILANH